tara:strand:+ start:293 stop:826 length:534 start_codon:yes stop_codon:yes gene_type:complete
MARTTKSKEKDKRIRITKPQAFSAMDMVEGKKKPSKTKKVAMAKRGNKFYMIAKSLRDDVYSGDRNVKDVVRMLREQGMPNQMIDRMFYEFANDMMKGGMVTVAKKMMQGGMAKMAKKKMRGGGMMKPKRMMGGGMAKMAKKKKMRGGGMTKMRGGGMTQRKRMMGGGMAKMAKKKR